MTDLFRSDRDLLAAAAREAGALALSYFKRDCRSWAKEGGSPVTEADFAVDRFLNDALLRARPDYGWLSEETADDPARLGCDAVFVVDPIDGTRGFMAGDRRWCVSIAVVRQGRPVAGALFAPALDRLYTATAGGGAQLENEPIAVSRRTSVEEASVGGPKGWFRHETIRRLGASQAPYLPSLAYRFALVADGRLDAAFAKPRSHDWDLAAADLLVHEAGGRLTSVDGQALRYNGETLRHGALAAGNAVLQPQLLAAVSAVVRDEEHAGHPA
ncbi:3'(2'),5'-bisphosphate nucleotidase CysQ [Propylenella binzhouense]|uniref:3'(2'),5'-bisphosphate nucleotidase CysQ n=1 Tax=Propylenella binzhouense TaxID=2555902 RepID=A0A964WV70_9HYPH|nr:3'(2'),5'-bisphosphate nucleotidase CysQ [Propylenella binzhouense]MYZ49912.1 3'(2'),5'-bisphosphate nucleotidase CysQ [Propylenella binzhouense]